MIQQESKETVQSVCHYLEPRRPKILAFTEERLPRELGCRITQTVAQIEPGWMLTFAFKLFPLYTPWILWVVDLKCETEGLPRDDHCQLPNVSTKPGFTDCGPSTIDTRLVARPPQRL